MKIKHKARDRDANKTQSEAKHFICIDAKCRVLYFSYSMSKAML